MNNGSTYRKEGYVLTTILLLIAVLSISLGSLIRFGGQQNFTTKRLINRTKALAYAEAGIEYGFSVVKIDFKNKDDINNFAANGATISEGSVYTPYGDGSFTLTIDPKEGDRYCVIRSEGICGDQSFTAEIVSEDKLAGTGTESESTGDPTKIVLPNIPVVSNGPLTLGGDVNVTGIDGSTPSIHSNTSGNISQKQSEANYLITTSGNWTKKTPLNGKTGVPEQDIPKIPLEAYEAAAYKINAGDAIPNPVPGGGILYIDNPSGTESTIDISGMTIAATIILAEGLNVKSPQGLNITPGTNPDNGQPFAIALALKGGNFDLNGGDITGLVYLPDGDFDMKGNPVLTGQILVNGDTTWGGTPDAFVYQQTILNPPTVTPTTTPALQDVWIGGWQK